MYTFDSRIRYSETDSEGRLTLLSLLNYFQDCSTFQSEDAGNGVEAMREKKLAWVLNAWQIVPFRYPKLGERVTIGTLPYEFQKFIGYRNFVMLDREGNYLAKANSIWSLINMETGRPVVATPEIMAGYAIEERIPMDYADRKIAVPAGGERREAITIMPHHLDTNHHVNNGQYVLIAQEFLPEKSSVKQLRVEYKKQAFLGDRLCPYVAVQDSKYIVSLQNEEGKGYATVEFDVGT